MKPRVLIADDHVILRSAVRALIAATDRFEVVGEAGDGAEAIQLAEALAPDVLIVDIAMPQLDGLAALRTLTARGAHPRIIVLSAHGQREYVVAALRAGAAGYLLKEAAFAELLTALDTVLAGRRYLGQQVAEIALDGLLGTAADAPAPSEGDAQLERLSAREREGLALLAQGFTNDEIGHHLCISAHTVQTHRKHIMEKLAIHRAIDLTRFALRHGLATLK